MLIDWNSVIERLGAYPPRTHVFQAPCPVERVGTVESELGTLPTDVRNMLHRFNGAELFMDAVPFVTLFGITLIPPLPPLEWAPDWQIDRYTPAWRSFRGSKTDWAIAMTNYGGLQVIDESGNVREWDTSAGVFSDGALNFSDWFAMLLRDGDICMRELAGE